MKLQKNKKRQTIFEKRESIKKTHQKMNDCLFFPLLNDKTIRAISDI